MNWERHGKKPFACLVEAQRTSVIDDNPRGYCTDINNQNEANDDAPPTWNGTWSIADDSEERDID